MIKIRLVATPEKLDPETEGLLHYLDGRCFPGDDLYEKRGAWWWLATEDGRPVAFAGMERSPCARGFLCRAGVLWGWRGQGLQRRLIRAREARGRVEGMKRMLTYVDGKNPRSSNNLIRSGYRLYVPGSDWGGPGCLYFYKDLED